MIRLNDNQINKLYELAEKDLPSDVTSNDINQVLIEIEKKLSTCAITISNYSTTQNVLIIDDLEITLHQLTLLLNKSGYNVQVARNKEEAKQNLQMHQYDFIFIDLFIPEPEDGMELIQLAKSKLNNDGKSPNIAIISGTEDNQLIEKCLKVGADEFIQKAQDWHKNVLKFIKHTQDTGKSTSENYIMNTKYADQKLMHIIIKKFHLSNTIENIEKEVVGFANTGYKNIVLDFSNITSLKQDQTQLLANCYTLCKNHGILLSLCSVSNDIHKILSYVFLTDIIEIYKNIDEAANR